MTIAKPVGADLSFVGPKAYSVVRSLFNKKTTKLVA
jgi:hypothetical protein